MKPIILIDSCSDLPLEYIKKNDITFFGFFYHLKDQDFKDDFGKSYDYHEFYEAVRAGEMPTTSQVNLQDYVNYFTKYVKKGNPIIYICFSSALSGCFNSANMAKKIVLEKYEDADITVIDSRSASLGEGLLVYYAFEMLKKGCSKDEIITWLEDNKLKMNHWFTVDSLNHLKRGGRISSTTAFVGNILNIKPILYVDDEGRLIPVSKVQGRKKSLRVLAEKLSEIIDNPSEQVIAISHGDCLQEAEHLKDILLKDFSFKKIIVNCIGPVVGSHSGPGTIALFFLGENRHM